MQTEFGHCVKINYNGESVSGWDNIITEAVALFGVDPARWRAQSTLEHMLWEFVDARDALLFRLKFSEHVIA